jgi:hypothetical protein
MDEVGAKTPLSKVGATRFLEAIDANFISHVHIQWLKGTIDYPTSA